MKIKLVWDCHYPLYVDLIYVESVEDAQISMSCTAWGGAQITITKFVQNNLFLLFSCSLLSLVTQTRHPTGTQWSKMRNSLAIKSTNKNFSHITRYQ
jgi:hypothetical protein